MLGLDNPLHLLFILALLLLVFGAKRLPEMGKSLGEGLRGFKDSISSDDAPTPLTAHTAEQHADAVTIPAHETTPGPAPERMPAQPVA
jgi:sec-independent protein translocase protein TatA